MFDAQATAAQELYLPLSPLGEQNPKNSLFNYCPPNQHDLVEKTMEAVTQELNSYGCMPTSSSCGGLSAIAKTLAAMAEGTALPKLFLSSLDPGLGKTTMVKLFIKTLLGSPHHQDATVLVCLSRLEEVSKMFGDLADCRDEVAIWTGDDEVNALASANKHDARVLLTTQQKLMAVCRVEGRFGQTEGFHCNGMPRDVRIWDESLMPGEEVMLSEDDLSILLTQFRQPSPKLCRALEDLREDLKACNQGRVFRVPSLEDMGGANGLSEVNRLLADPSLTNADRERLERLCQAAGQSLPVHRNTFNEVKLLDYRDTVPNDLYPLLVLDASGRCRNTYDLMEQRGIDIERLPKVAKDYSNLTLHLWSRGSGKSAYANDTKEVLVRGMAEQIAKRPDETWLIVHNKDNIGDLKKRLNDHLGGAHPGKLHFLHWGQHHGTNTFADVPNVILASLLNLPPEVHHARVRLCAGMAEDEKVSPKQADAMELGEHQHNVLQALCRASVRGLQPDGTCPPCRAYIIAPTCSGIEAALPTLFPGSKPRAWKPRGATRLTRSITRALHQIDKWTSEGFGDEIAYCDLADAIDMDGRTFRKRVATDDRFLEEVKDKGYAETELMRMTSKGERMAKGIVKPGSVFRSD